MQLVILVAVAILVAVTVSWWISTANTFRRLIVKIDESSSGIDVALTKRFDNLTKMVDACKGFAKHETELLGGIVSLRKGLSIKEKEEVNRKMDDAADRISVVAEAYPELKSSNNFIKLQEAISDVEEHLQAARRLYNMNVSLFNQLLVSFPSSVIGNMQKQQPKEFFAAEERKKSDVKMEF